MKVHLPTREKEPENKSSFERKKKRVHTEFATENILNVLNTRNQPKAPRLRSDVGKF